MNRQSIPALPREAHVRQVEDNILSVENSFGNLCQSFSDYIRKYASVRDKGDTIAKESLSAADLEKNPSLKEILRNFAYTMDSVQDHKELLINRLQDNTVDRLMTWGPKCKSLKSQIKVSLDACTKEKKLSSQNAASLPPRKSVREISRQQLANDFANGCSERLDKMANDFEKEKVDSLFEILREFVHSQIVFHARALEIYSRCYSDFQSVDATLELTSSNATPISCREDVSSGATLYRTYSHRSTSEEHTNIEEEYTGSESAGA